MALLRTYSVLVVHDGFTEVATGHISLKFIRTDQLDLSLSLSGPFGLRSNANNLPKAAAAAIVMYNIAQYATWRRQARRCGLAESWSLAESLCREGHDSV